MSNILIEIPASPNISRAQHLLRERGLVVNLIMLEFIAIFNAMISTAYSHGIDITTLSQMNPMQFMKNGDSVIVETLKSAQRPFGSSIEAECFNIGIVDLMNSLSLAYKDILATLIGSDHGLIEFLVKNNLDLNFVSYDADRLIVTVPPAPQFRIPTAYSNML